MLKFTDRQVEAEAQRILRHDFDPSGGILNIA
jgi:hypothetical protein